VQSHFVSSDLEEYVFSFQKPTVAKIIKLVNLLEQFGSALRMPYSKQVAPHLFELRIRGKEEVRIFYCFHKGAVVFVHACQKKSQQLPLREIEYARTKQRALTKNSIYAIN